MNLAGALPRSRRLIVDAAWIPDCMATSATPGRSSSAIMSPIANTSGWPGTVQSSPHQIRPARSQVAPLASREQAGQGRGLHPAAQILVRAEIRSVEPSSVRTSTPSASTPVTMVPVWIVTPSRRSSWAAFSDSLSPNAVRIAGPPSTSTTVASAGSIRRKLPASPVRDSSAI